MKTAEETATYVELMEYCLTRAEGIYRRRWGRLGNYREQETLARLAVALFEAEVKEAHLLRAIFMEKDGDTH